MGQHFARRQEQFLRDNIGGVERGLIDSLPDPVARAWMRLRGYHLETEFLTNWQANLYLYKYDELVGEEFVDLAEVSPEDMVMN